MQISFGWFWTYLQVSKTIFLDLYLLGIFYLFKKIQKL